MQGAQPPRISATDQGCRPAEAPGVYVRNGPVNPRITDFTPNTQELKQGARPAPRGFFTDWRRMARINIEDSIYKDDRWMELILKTGCQYKALGLLVSAWTLSQKHYLSEETDRLIPKDQWKATAYRPLIEVGFADELEKGFYLRGAESQFGWLLQRANAGKLGGRPKKPETDRLSEQTDRLSGESGRVIGPNPLYSSSLLSPLSQEETKKEKKAEAAVVKITPSATRQASRSEIFHVSCENDLILGLPEAAKLNWSKLYPDPEFLSRTLLKALNYYQNNPKKMPKQAKGWVRALSHWFENDWVKFVKTIPANQAPVMDSNFWAKFKERVANDAR